MKVTLNLRLLHKYKMTLSDKDILKGMCRFRTLYDENCKQTADFFTYLQADNTTLCALMDVSSQTRVQSTSASFWSRASKALRTWL